MQENKYTYILAVLCFIIGITCIVLRIDYRHKHPLAADQQVWRLKTTINLENIPGKQAFSVGIPDDLNGVRVIRRETIHPGITTFIQKDRVTGRSLIHCLTTEQKSSQLLAQSDFLVSENKKVKKVKKIKPENRIAYISAEANMDINSVTVQNTLKQLISAKKITKDNLVDIIFKYCCDELVNQSDGADTPEKTILSGKGSSKGKATTFVTLCRAAKIPARLLCGFELHEGYKVKPHVWAQVYLKNQWVDYDPVYELSDNMPNNLVAVRINSADPVKYKAKTSGKIKVEHSLIRIPPPAELNNHTSFISSLVDLQALPLQRREVMALILLIPFGALITSFFRNIIGLHTYGVFTPSLLALSVIRADALRSIIVFAIIIIISLTSRKLLDKIKLLMAPRLSIVLTLIVLMTALSVSLLDHLNPLEQDNVILLPMVILTMLTERFFITEQEDSTGHALKLLGQTLITAFFCYVILSSTKCAGLLLSFPEIHFFTLTVLLLIGRYTGFRITEYIRFKDIPGNVNEPSV